MRCSAYLKAMIVFLCRTLYFIVVFEMVVIVITRAYYLLAIYVVPLICIPQCILLRSKRYSVSYTQMSLR